MNYLPTLAEDEIKYICSVIPLERILAYFKRYPKEFGKIKPGFRSTKLSQEQACATLFQNRNQPFIASFIENQISRWLDEIAATIKEKVDNGESRESVFLQTLPYCFFADNIGLYFRLADEQYPEEYISLLSESIIMIKKETEAAEQNKHEFAKLDKKLEQIDKLESKLQGAQIEKDNLRKELKELKKKEADTTTLEQTIASLKQDLEKQEDCVRQLLSDLAAAIDEQEQLEQKIREEVAKQQEIENQQRISQKAMRPKDINEFKEYLGYNLENIGIPTDEDYFLLLKEHLCDILFQGKPIVINKSTSMPLMSCISNTLAGTPSVSVITFSDQVMEKAIDDFLSKTDRVLCLDNFIGNYNETVLTTICDRHKDKIIFLTLSYDHTLAYVPDEMMRYYHYLNLNRIQAFIYRTELTEDPSKMDEKENTDNVSKGKPSRWSEELKKMLDELGMGGAFAAHKVSLLTDETSLCGMLAFDILPWCTDVLRIRPFDTSERLVKYAGSSGRCQYKVLFKRWFA